MNTNKTEYYEIMAGPNRDALFDACKYAHTDTARIPILFEVAITSALPSDNRNNTYIPMAISDISITSIEYEDNSGESFNLEGNCNADLDSLEESNVNYKPYRFQAYYNSKKRKGRITFKE